jgi:hypothetical protein
MAAIPHSRSSDVLPCRWDTCEHPDAPVVDGICVECRLETVVGLLNSTAYFCRGLRDFVFCDDRRYASIMEDLDRAKVHVETLWRWHSGSTSDRA